eukprot:m.196753 g.196753  ORF g.196753 m.196753 type:complete len:55 (-) comp15257_c0_seq3:3653-3817(-)
MYQVQLLTVTTCLTDSHNDSLLVELFFLRLFQLCQCTTSEFTLPKQCFFRAALS